MKRRGLFSMTRHNWSIQFVSDVHDNKHGAQYILIASFAQFGFILFQSEPIQWGKQKGIVLVMLLFCFIFAGFLMWWRVCGAVVWGYEWIQLSLKVLAAPSPGPAKPVHCSGMISATCFCFTECCPTFFCSFPLIPLFNYKQIIK